MPINQIFKKKVPPQDFIPDAEPECMRHSNTNQNLEKSRRI